jgi:hypothetical protein
VTTPNLPDEPLSPDVTEDVLGQGKAGKPRKSRAYRNLTAAGITSEIANSIRQRAAILDKDGGRCRAYFKRALIVHGLLEDYHARNAPDIEGIKSASAGMMAVVDKLFPKQAAGKKTA